MTAAAGIDDVLALCGGAAPRYTSYPSAAHFIKGFDPQNYETWLMALPDDYRVSLYIHVPFCRSLCHYCGCFTKVARQDGPVFDYLELIYKEIALIGDLTGRRLLASRVHFGGGSPNLLNGSDLDRLLAKLDLNFNIESDAEIAMEIDPRQMNAEKAKAYARAGINRVSLGVQDFTEATQKAINRIQPFSAVSSCVSSLRECGIGKINFDLIYGLPFQTPETLAANAYKTASLGVDRVALFGYAHVPFFRPQQKNLERFGLPDSLQRYEQEKAARTVFADEGYEAIGMDHFALPDDSLAVAARTGGLRRNFQGYTDDTSSGIIGLGASAISRVGDAYAQNSTSFEVYESRIAEGRIAVDRGYVMDAQDRLRAEVIERLMCDFSVDTADICERHGFRPGSLDESFERLAPYEAAGLIERHGRVMTVTQGNTYFVRSICAVFDAHFNREGARYAKAV